MATIERFLPETSKKQQRTQRLVTKGGSESPRGKGKSIGVRTNPRRWVGVALLILSVIGGYLSVSHADKRIQVLVLKNDLASGQRINADDLQIALAALPHQRYALTFDQVVGRAVKADAQAGELIPLSALADREERNLVAIPVRAINLPPLNRGERVDVWSQGFQVAASLPIAELTREATTVVVTVEVPPQGVASLVAALAEDVTLVKSA